MHISLDERGLPAAQFPNDQDLEQEFMLGLVQEFGGRGAVLRVL